MESPAIPVCARAGDVGGDVVGIGGKGALEVGVHRHLHGGGDRRRSARALRRGWRRSRDDRGVHANPALVVASAENPSFSRTMRAADVPRVRHDEAAGLVQLPELLHARIEGGHARKLARDSAARRTVHPQQRDRRDAVARVRARGPANCWISPPTRCRLAVTPRIERSELREDGREHVGPTVIRDSGRSRDRHRAVGPLRRGGAGRDRRRPLGTGARKRRLGDPRRDRPPAQCQHRHGTSGGVARRRTLPLRERSHRRALRADRQRARPRAGAGVWARAAPRRSGQSDDRAGRPDRQAARRGRRA